MANEAEQVEGPYTTHDYTVNVASAIPQYTLMVGADPRTAQASTGDSSAAVSAGILMSEKVADNGVVDHGMTKEGIWVLTNSHVAIAAGKPVVISGLNTVRAAVAGDLLTGAVIGHTLEALEVDGTGEVQLLGY